MTSTQSHRLTVKNIIARLFDQPEDQPRQDQYNQSIRELVLVIYSMLDQIDDLQAQIMENEK